MSASDIKNATERFCVEESFILLRKTKTLPNNLISCRFCNEESSIFFQKDQDIAEETNFLQETKPWYHLPTFCNQIGP